jgi:hypothetical protein
MRSLIPTTETMTPSQARRLMTPLRAMMKRMTRTERRFARLVVRRESSRKS